MSLMSLVLVSSLPLVPSGKPIEILSILKYYVMGHVKYYLKKKKQVAYLILILRRVLFTVSTLGLSYFVIWDYPKVIIYF